MKNLSSRFFRSASKEFMTEAEQQTSDSQAENKRKKQSFNVRRIMEHTHMQEQRKKNLKIVLFKLLTWITASSAIFVGHFYCAIFIMWSASMLHMDVISLGHVIRKDNVIEFNWLDVYWYAVGAYICIPNAFLRRRLIGNDVYF